MKNISNQTKYKILAPVYDLFMGSRLFLNARKKAFGNIQFKVNDRVLLVGVGTGQDLRLLPDDINIVGIDISEEMLALASEKGPNAETQLIQMNAEQLDFKNESFDVVVLHLILSVVEHPNQALKEALRVVKRDGRTLIFDKFLPEDQKPSMFRKLFNILSTTIGTDINRKFGEINQGVPFRTISDERSIFYGGYRIIVLAKDE